MPRFLERSPPIPADAKLEKLVDSLFASLAEYPMWRGFLAALAAGCGADHASLVLERGGHQLPAEFVSHDELLTQVDQLRDGGFFRGLPPDGVVDTTVDAAVPRALVMSQAYEAGGHIHLALWSKADGGPFGADAAALLTALGPALRRAAGLYFHMAVMHRRLEVATTVLEATDTGVILVDQDGTVLQTNRVADQILAGGDGIQVAAGRLRASTHAETATLVDHIRRKAQQQTRDIDWSNYEPVSLSRAGSDVPLTAIVRPGPAFRPALNPLRRTAILILRDPRRERLIPPANLARLFGLTRSEALLASQMARGMGLKDVAATIGISHNTARVQLQSVFAKTGTSSQQELVRLLLSSAAPLTG